MPPSKSPVLFVVDDDPLMRSLLEHILRPLGHSVESFESAAAFLTDCQPDQPGCLILDLRLDGTDGFQLLADLSSRRITLPVILISAYASVDIAVRAMKQHAFDFFEKPLDASRLLERVGEAIAQDRAARLADAARQEVVARIARLTPRERQVMRLVVTGLANKRAAAELGISEKTIEIHRAHVMRKMEAQSIAELVRHAMTADAAGIEPAVAGSATPPALRASA